MTRHLESLLTTSIQAVGDGSCRVELAGEIDLAVADQLGAALDLVIAHFTGDIVIDATGLEFCDALGVGILADFHGQARRRSRRLVLCNPPAAVQRLLEITSGTYLLDVESGRTDLTGDANLTGRSYPTRC